MLSDGYEVKVTARSMRCEKMIHIRADAKGDVLVKQMLAAAFKTMLVEASTRNHAGEFLPGGRFAVKGITEDMRKRLGPMPTPSMTC